MFGRTPCVSEGGSTEGAREPTEEAEEAEEEEAEEVGGSVAEVSQRESETGKPCNSASTLLTEGLGEEELLLPLALSSDRSTFGTSISSIGATRNEKKELTSKGSCDLARASFWLYGCRGVEAQEDPNSGADTLAVPSSDQRVGLCGSSQAC